MYQNYTRTPEGAPTHLKGGAQDFVAAGSGKRREGRFYQVTCAGVRQDSQQVVVAGPLHHLLHLHNRKLVDTDNCM